MHRTRFNSLFITFTTGILYGRHIITHNDNEVMNNSKSNYLLEILPFLGIAFWFFLAFPLADRNESYLWITYLQKYSILEIIENPIPSVRSFRPLAQAAAWCLYHLSGNNGVLIQALNFVLLCVAIRIMISITAKHVRDEARLFYLMIGFVYFSAFYYIFNLHGIFYSVIATCLQNGVDAAKYMRRVVEAELAGETAPLPHELI